MISIVTIVVLTQPDYHQTLSRMKCVGADKVCYTMWVLYTDGPDNTETPQSGKHENRMNEPADMWVCALTSSVMGGSPVERRASDPLNLCKTQRETKTEVFLRSDGVFSLLLRVHHQYSTDS